MRSTRNQHGRGSGGVTGKGFRPGQSGNPSGRPRGLAELVRASTRDGAELVQLVRSVLRGEPVGGKKPRVQDMLEAARWLGDRGWGKPSQPLEGGEPDRPVTIKIVWEDVGVTDRDD